ncbi:MAG TPA: tetratricopeptide repeat protein [Chthoniobacterales bacterium]|nr:tetratricopeptide repeat protein [Chthoniobacterales bacterium]
MTFLRHLALGLAAFLWAVLSSPFLNAAPSDDPDKDPDLPKRLHEARALIDDKKPQPGIAICDKVIAAFQAHYGKSKHKIYCARSQTENLAYLVTAAAAMSKGEFDKGKKDAICLSSTWANAFYIKGYALQELRRLAEAKAALKRAIEFSPQHSQYLSELGSLYVLEKNWDDAMKTFLAAEDDAAISPDDVRSDELGRARRGIGYVLVELGKLDEAEKKYEQCLADNPKDSRAAEELKYVRNLKAKKRGNLN